MITDYMGEGGAGSTETPKSDYVIYGQPLIYEMEPAMLRMNGVLLKTTEDLGLHQSCSKF